MLFRSKFILSFIVLFTFLSCEKKEFIEVNDKENDEQTEILGNLLPQLTITTNGKTIVDEPKIEAQVQISKEDIVPYTVNIGIEIRGATSQTFPKKSYGFETWDTLGNDIDVSLLGLPEEEDWILYAPYSDKSLIRNVLIYDLSRAIDRYASRTEFVELTINGEYNGVYVFMEKLKRDKNRIDINKLKVDENSGEDVTGGYVLKIDKTAGSNAGGDGYNNLNSFSSKINQDIHFLYDYPDAEEITNEQKTYISSYIEGFETALFSNDFKDVNTGYRSFIDVPSFIDFFLLNELSNNVDGYRISTYMNKDKNGKLKMGPIWDFNLAFGNANYCGGDATDVWTYKFNERCPDDNLQVPFWWERLLQDPYFVAELKNRWIVLRSGVFSEVSIIAKIDEYNDVLKNADAIHRNFETWDVLGTYIWPNKFIGNSYLEENNYLKEWVKARLVWLDVAIDAL